MSCRDLEVKLLIDRSFAEGLLVPVIYYGREIQSSENSWSCRIEASYINQSIQLLWIVVYNTYSSNHSAGKTIFSETEQLWSNNKVSNIKNKYRLDIDSQIPIPRQRKNYYMPYQSC